MQEYSFLRKLNQEPELKDSLVTVKMLNGSVQTGTIKIVRRSNTIKHQLHKGYIQLCIDDKSYVTLYISDIKSIELLADSESHIGKKPHFMNFDDTHTLSHTKSIKWTKPAMPRKFAKKF